MTAIIAHRGASRSERENTIAAFRRAAELGADGVELDVRRTADDHLVVHHDASLPDGRPIRTTLRADLPEHVPDLAEALDVCDRMLVNLEIKNVRREPDYDPTDWVAEQVAVELARRGSGPRWLVSSFRYDTVQRTRVLLPDARTAWLRWSLTRRLIDRAVADGHDALHPWVKRVDEHGIRAAHAAGLDVNVWTCNEPDRIRQLIEWGVDGICTDVPDVALAVRRDVQGDGNV